MYIYEDIHNHKNSYILPWSSSVCILMPLDSLRSPLGVLLEFFWHSRSPIGDLKIGRPEAVQCSLWRLLIATGVIFDSLLKSFGPLEHRVELQTLRNHKQFSDFETFDSRRSPSRALCRFFWHSWAPLGAPKNSRPTIAQLFYDFAVLIPRCRT